MNLFSGKIMGSDTKYRSDMPARALKMALAGATMDDIARAFGVRRDTLEGWVEQRGKLREAIECGFMRFRSECAEKNLFRRVEGYFYEERTEELRKVEELDPATGRTVAAEKPVVVRTVHKHVPPDTRAVIFAVKCLLPEKYRERQEARQSGLDELAAELEEARKRAG
jgi:transposase-like protein